MSRTSKILITLISSLLISVIIFFIYLSTQINTDSIKKIIVEQIENNLQDSKVNINTISYSFGRKITFHISQLNIDQPNNKALAVNDIKVKVPIYSILTRGGAVDIVINEPNVFLLEVDGKTNWELFLKNSENKQHVKVKVPSFLEQSRINLKVNNLSLRMLDQEIRLPVDKILLKNISLKKMTAFDISSQLDLEYDDKKIKVHYDIVGETLIRDFLEGRDTKVNFMTNFRNISLNEIKIPNTKIKGLITVNKNNNISFSLRNDIETVLSGEVKGSLTESSSRLSVETFNQEIIINNAIKFLPELNESFMEYSEDNIELETSGTFKLDMTNKEFVPFVSFKTSKPFNLTYDDYKLNVAAEGAIQGSELISNAEIKAMQGVINTKLQTKISNNLDNISKLSTLVVDINTNSLRISIPPLKLSSGEDEKNDKAVEPKFEYPELNLPEILINIKGESNQINNLSFDTNGQVKVQKNKIEIKNIRNIFNEKGIVATSAQVEVNPKRINLTSDTEITNINMGLFNSFLPPELGKIEGDTNGQVVLKGSLDDVVIEGDVKLINGKVQDLDLNDYVLPVLKEYKINIKKQKSLNLSSGFELLTSKFRFANEIVTISTLELNTSKNELKLNANGKLGLSEKIKSKIFLNILNREVSKQLKTKTGKSELPLLLRGDGLVVTPDLNYTVGKVSKRILKLQKKQLKQNIKKEKKKIEKKLEDKAKKLLKGIKL